VQGGASQVLAVFSQGPLGHPLPALHLGLGRLLLGETGLVGDGDVRDSPLAGSQGLDPEKGCGCWRPGGETPAN
jgi:hypothetical protein